jgi:hypothetical protein
MNTVRAPRSSSFSPPSSPSLRTIDSSPLSSPEPEPIIADSPVHLPHPFSASFKANRAPPQHEQKTSVPFIEFPPDISLEPPRKRYRTTTQFEVDNYASEEVPFFYPPQTPEEVEMEIWDMAITKVVDAGHGAVTLRQAVPHFLPWYDVSFDRTIFTATRILLLFQKKLRNLPISSPYLRSLSRSTLIALSQPRLDLEVVCSPV